jgi:ATP-binding cassette subfamily F protein 3
VLGRFFVLLQMKDIQKAIGAEEILVGVSFLIEEKEKVALVGVNGAGKTSVFRIITGEWQADDGEVIGAGGMRVGYLPQLNDEVDLENLSEKNFSLYDALDSVFLPLKKMEAEIRGLEAAMANLSGEKLQSALARYDNLSFRFKDEGGFEAESRLKGVLRGLGFSEQQWAQPFSQLSGGQRRHKLARGSRKRFIKFQRDNNRRIARQIFYKKTRHENT